jgi:PAP2 superfamily
MEENMGTLIVHVISRSVPAILVGAWMAVGAAAAARANVITDWDAKAVAFAAPGAQGQRELAMVHVAMFDAVNAIERRYRPYLVQLTVPTTTSQEAAAATAAGTVLAGLPARRATAEMKAALASYLAALPDSEARSAGMKLGEAVAAKVLEARRNDGANAPDAYRPRTTAGVYVPTPITLGSTWPAMTPFALTKPSQFRPQPPIPLANPEWAADYNELKDYGGKTSTKRSAQQTEAARFWLMVGAPAYHPIPRQLIAAKQMSVIDSARFMALFAVALTDAYMAVFDAKYHYEFWRPITAIRNGDIDGNPATELEATWQPIDNTPLHPEYPCAHCIESGAAVAVIESVLGSADIPEVSIASSTVPGVTHRWTNLLAFAEEIANARIWAGFHYRFSTRVGTDMGRKIGEYVVKSVMQPTTATSAR